MLTADQINSVAKLAAEHHWGDSADFAEFSGAIVLTREPMQNFIDIADQHETDADFGDGHVLTGVQRNKGDARTTICAIDFGDVLGIHES